MHTMSRQKNVCLHLMVQILLCSSTITQLDTLEAPFSAIISMNVIHHLLPLMIRRIILIIKRYFRQRIVYCC